MAMHNPPHPGEFIAEVYLEPNDISGRELATKLGVSASTLSRILEWFQRCKPGDGIASFQGLGSVSGELVGDAEQLRSLARKEASES
jgi:antitoxin HigA-1